MVVGGVDHGESDRIVHLLTEDGRLDVFAPGARKSRRRFAGAFEPFQTIEIATHEGGRRRPGLVTATSARVLQPRLGIRSDLERISLASYAAELCRRVAPEGEATGAFAGLVELLDYLERGAATACVRRAFEARLLGALGYQPSVEGCVVCGRAEPPFLVSFEDGGLTCASHGIRGDRVGPGTLAWLRAVIDPSELAPRGPHDEADALRAARTIGPALDRFYAQLLAGPLRTGALLRDLGI